MGRSLKRDRQQKAERKVKSGRGDRGVCWIAAGYYSALGTIVLANAGGQRSAKRLLTPRQGSGRQTIHTKP